MLHTKMKKKLIALVLSAIRRQESSGDAAKAEEALSGQSELLAQSGALAEEIRGNDPDLRAVMLPLKRKASN